MWRRQSLTLTILMGFFLNYERAELLPHPYLKETPVVPRVLGAAGGQRQQIAVIFNKMTLFSQQSVVCTIVSTIV